MTKFLVQGSVTKKALERALLLITVTFCIQQVPPARAAQEGPKPPVTEYPETAPRRPAPARSDSSASAGPNVYVPLQSLTLGALRVTPAYVDTGPFAAAEEHIFWTPTAPQVVVVTAKSQELDNGGGLDPASLVALGTDGGRVYELLGPNGEHELTGERTGLPVLVWVFKVAPGERPSRLLIDNPEPGSINCPGAPSGLIHRAGGSPETSNPNCREERDPDWRKLGTNHVVLSLVGLPSRNDIADIAQHSASVRFGQLEIRATAVGLAAREWDQAGPRAPEHGHKVVRVSLAIRNVSEYPNCTGLDGSDVRLLDSRGFEYRASALTSDPYKGWDLLTGERTGAIILFEIWGGTAPMLIAISRSVSWERVCTEKQHRPVDMHGGSKVRIPITRVPAVSTGEQR